MGPVSCVKLVNNPFTVGCLFSLLNVLAIALNINILLIIIYNSKS